MPTIININKIIIIITTILIVFLTTEALGSVPPSLGHCNIITVLLGLTLFRLPSFYYHLSFQRHAWASFASCSCACVNLWLLWEDLEICGQPWHSEYGHIFLQASVYVLHCTIYTWLLVIPLPVLGLALASFPLTGLCLPCGSGRVLYEVSVRRPLIPLCHLCTSTCLSLAPCGQTLIPLGQTSFSWWTPHNTIISLLT